MAVELENGKVYETVAERLREFRKTHPAKEGWAIETTLEFPDADTVRVVAKIKDPAGRVVATGHAEENRGESPINKIAAVENCETSAVGRALFMAGFGNGEVCSADELLMALRRQERLNKAREGVGAPSPTVKPMPELKADTDAPVPGRDQNAAPSDGDLPPPPKGVEWVVNGDDVLAVGKGTFDHKEALKAMGFRWSKDAKAWKARLNDLRARVPEEIPF